MELKMGHPYFVTQPPYSMSTAVTMIDYSNTWDATTVWPNWEDVAYFQVPRATGYVNTTTAYNARIYIRSIAAGVYPNVRIYNVTDDRTYPNGTNATKGITVSRANTAGYIDIVGVANTLSMNRIQVSVNNAGEVGRFSRMVIGARTFRYGRFWDDGAEFWDTYGPGWPF